MKKNDWIESAHAWLTHNIQGTTREHIPVFDHLGLVVKVNMPSSGKAGVLCRSDRFDRELAEITDSVRTGYEAGVEGMLYCLYVLEDGRPIPIYFGIARSTGQNGTLSSLFRSPRKKPRFDDYDGSHIGDLSTQVVPGHAKKKAYKKIWADQMFSNAPHRHPRLRTPVYFWGKAWQAGDPSVVTYLGHAPLLLEEQLLIHAFRIACPGRLLNR